MSRAAEAGALVLIISLSSVDHVLLASRYYNERDLARAAIVSVAGQRIGPATPAERVMPAAPADVAAPELEHAPEPRFAYRSPARPEFADVVTTTGAPTASMESFVTYLEGGSRWVRIPDRS